MDAERSPQPEACQIRIDRLRELAHSLERAYHAMLRSDLPEITRQTACQQELCAQLRQLSAESMPLTSAEELAEVEAEVARWNRSYQALLRRAARTVEIFCRVLASSALTYPPPRPEAGSCAAGVQE